TRGTVEHLVEVALALLSLRRLLGLGLARHSQAGQRGQCFNRLWKVDTVVIHDEADGVAAGTAAEAVEKLFVRADAERGGLFVVKWAARGVVAATFAQRYAAVDNLDDIDPFEQVIDEGLRNATGHTTQSFQMGEVITLARHRRRRRGFNRVGL